MQHTYLVAGHYFRVTAPDTLKAWAALEWHYQPFRADSGNASLLIDIEIVAGDKPDGLGNLLFVEPEQPGMLSMKIFKTPDQAWAFELKQPGGDDPNGWIIFSPGYAKARIVVKPAPEGASRIAQWRAESTVTSAMMLAYLLASTPHDTLMAHAASVLHDGKAYLFIAKSGTGKSTHARLWLKNIPGCELLNDDHPIVRLRDGHAIAYGSPWSGKTDCYRNLQAPVGAIVRIKRAPFDRLNPLSPLQAYASLATSFSGMTFEPLLADSKHSNIERLIACTPCFTLECLPDDLAATVCHEGVVNS